MTVGLDGQPADNDVVDIVGIESPQDLGGIQRNVTAGHAR
jgi:hypothetical protein